jgi:hypothetical protein
VTTYNSSSGISSLAQLEFNVFPNPTAEIFVIQVGGLVEEAIHIRLVDLKGKVVQEQTIQPGSTLGYIDISTVYNGSYLMEFSTKTDRITRKVQVLN